MPMLEEGGAGAGLAAGDEQQLALGVRRAEADRFD